MRSSHSLDRLDTAFDDDRLVADTGLLLPATLAAHLGLKELVEEHLDLGAAAGRANVGDKVLTLVMSALAGGDCIDDAAALRAGGTEGVLGFVVKAASTLGTFLRSFRWGHVRQLDAVSRELLARAWAAGAGPGSAPFTIDLDSTICETYGLKKEGALHHGYTKVRGYHPLLAVAAGTGDVLMARLREGRANTTRGAAHFLAETIGRVRHAGATGQLTMRADSGFYAHAVVAVCRRMDVRFSITLRMHRGVRGLIEAIPEAAWTPIPYCDRRGCRRGRDNVRPVQGRAGRGARPPDRPPGPPDPGLPARGVRPVRLRMKLSTPGCPSRTSAYSLQRMRSTPWRRAEIGDQLRRAAGPGPSSRSPLVAAASFGCRVRRAATKAT
jgi:Transposase DDE domain group 1